MKIGNKNHRDYIALIPTIIFGPIISVMIISLVVFLMCYYPKEKFDNIKWKTNIEERYRMSEDIIKNYILIGRTKSEIIELLGDEFYVHSDGAISYYLGFVPPIKMDPDILTIYFEDGLVVKVIQRRT
jgi:hypothetical protein